MKREQLQFLKKFLFGFTRVFALLGSLIAILGIILLLLALFEPGNKENYVSLSELRPDQQADTEIVSPNIDVEIPAIVREYLSDENEPILYGWIESLDKNDQQDFLDNLSVVISEAEKNNDDVFEVINDYKTTKLERLQETQFEKYEKIATKTALIGGIFGLVLFTALMSLVLVMLAVERNTRITITSHKSTDNL